MTAPVSIKRLADGINSHDPDQVAAAFTDDYACEMPMHPTRGFNGSDTVRANYETVFARTPDLHAEILRWAVNGEETWSEWDMHGTNTDGSAAVLRGTVISYADGDGPIRRTRFYLDPVVDE